MAPGETPTETAVRELREEAGIVGGRAEFRLTLDLDLDRSVHQTHLVMVYELTSAGDGEFPTEWLPLGQAFALVEGGRITHAPTVAAIMIGLVDRSRHDRRST